MPRRFTLEQKKAWIAEWNSSSKTKKVFAQEIGVARSAFCRWTRELDGGQGFVKIGTHRKPQSEDRMIEAEYRGCVLHFAEGSLHAVLEALSAINA